jgi:chromosome segregation ATPase
LSSPRDTQKDFDLVTFSAITIALLVTTAGFCFSAGWTARRISTSGRDVELKRNVYEAKGAIPQLESTLRNRDQRITMLTTEAQSLRDRLTQAEAAAAQKEAEIVKRDREIRLARSELQIVKDGSIGGVENPDLVDGADIDTDPHAEADPKIVIEMKRLEARYESLKKGLIQRDDRIAALEQELAGGPGKRSVQILEQELADLQVAAELAQTTLAARDTLIRDLQAKLQADVEQRELLETLTKRRGDANRNLKENYAKLEAQLPKLMETLKQRGDIITEREATIAMLDADLSHVRGEKAAREATIVELEGKLAAQREQIAQQTSNYQTQKQHLHQVEQRADMLAHEVAETTKALQASHGLVRERDAAMEAKDARLQGVDEKLREQGNTMASLQKLLKDRDFKIDSLVADLAGAEAKANAARDEVAKQIAANHALQRNLGKWEQRVTTLQAALAESGNAAQANQAQAQERDVAVEERDARLRDIDAKVREQAEQIVSLQGVISARDDEVEALNADIAALRMKLVAASAQPAAPVQSAPLQMADELPIAAPVAAAPAHDVDEQVAAANQRADRTERELNSNAREMKTMKAQLAELETRCASLDGLLRGKDATLTERARRIEDLQDQLMRLEARVDERNREIADLKRARDEAPPAPSPYMVARNNPISYTPQTKPI